LVARIKIWRMKMTVARNGLGNHRRGVINKWKSSGV
jgi:hypothetical protein